VRPAYVRGSVPLRPAGVAGRLAPLVAALVLLASPPAAAQDLVSALHDSLRGADTIVLQLKPVRAWGSMRHALQLPIPWTLRAPLAVPEAARLEVAIALLDRLFGEPVAERAQPTRFRLSFTPEGGTRVALLERVVDPRHRPRDRGWLGRRIDLGPFAGQRGTLEIRVEVAGAPEEHGATFALVTRPILRSEAAPAVRPNLLLVTIDALRADHLRCYGYHRLTTPALDRLAAEGVRFAHAFANAPMTVPSLPQLFTGRHFPQPGAPTLLSSLYATPTAATLAIVRNPYLHAFLTLDARDSFDRLLLLDSWRAPHISRAALTWIDRHRDDEPWALYLHYLDTHTPYLVPEPDALRFADPTHRGAVGHTFKDVELARRGGFAAADRQRIIDLYDGAIHWVDSHLGAVLDGLRARGLLERTLVVVTADHGEELFDRDSFFHGQSLYDEQLRVPLLVRFPQARHAGTVVEAQVGLVDLLPSIADALELPLLGPVDGASWLPQVRGEPAPVRPLFARAANPERPWRYAVRLPAHKLILTVEPPTEQLFDLATDPGERIDRIADPAAASARDALRALLDTYRAPLAEHGFQLRAVPRPGAPVELEVRIRTTERAAIANPDRIGALRDDRLQLRADGLELSWRTRLDGTPQGIRFDRTLNYAAKEGSLSVEAWANGRQISPDALRIGGDARPADRLPLSVRTAPSRPFAPKVETPSLGAERPPALDPPTHDPVRLYLWRRGDAATGGVAAPPIDQDQRQRLRALGYAD